MRYIIQMIDNITRTQMFITTHNSMICSGLNLKNLIILPKNSNKHPFSLIDLNDETCRYFLKAPVADIIRYVLANKVILVEGPSEYILFDNFYKKIVNRGLYDDKIAVIDIRGLSFKRYLEIARLTSAKVAVVTDNDGFKSKRIDNLLKYEIDNRIKIFYNSNSILTTFESVLYEKNKDLFEKMNISIESLLKDKTESALELVNKNVGLDVPDYIKDAIEWVRN